MDSAFFKNLFVKAASATDRTWVIQVNDSEQAVVYCVQSDGSPASMTCGTIKEVILDALLDQCGDYVVDRIRSPDFPTQYGFRQDRWRDVLETITSRKSTVARARARCCLEIHYWSDFSPIRRYLDWPSQYRWDDIRLLPAAIGADFRRDRDASAPVAATSD